MRIIRLADEKFKKSPVPHIPLHEKGGLEEGRIREKILVDAIKKLAEEWDIGPIDNPVGIDSRGDITLKQRMINNYNYESDKEINPELIKIAEDYERHGTGSLRLGGHIGSHWIRLNHFVWERLLGDMGLLPRPVVGEDEFEKQLRSNFK